MVPKWLLTECQIQGHERVWATIGLILEPCYKESAIIPAFNDWFLLFVVVMFHMVMQTDVANTES